jgi:AraC-like DNA-binding protein
MMVGSFYEHVSLSMLNVMEVAYNGLSLRGLKEPQWVISHVLEGQVSMHTKGRPYEAGAGWVMIHPPDVAFDEYSQNTGVHQVMYLGVNVSSNIDLFRLLPVYPVVKLADATKYSLIFRRLLHYWNEPLNSERDWMVMNLTLQLVSEVMESWIRSGREPRPAMLSSPQDRYIEIIRYMSGHLAERLSREQLAAILPVHPNYLDRIFQKQFNKTPMQMLREMRLKKAKHLLESTDMPLSSIAVLCGMNDASYLSKTFLKMYGVAPGEHRNKQQEREWLYHSK